MAAPLRLVALVLAALVLVLSLVRADPETVDGLYLTKKSDPGSVPKHRNALPAVGSTEGPRPQQKGGGGSFRQAQLGGGRGRGRKPGVAPSKQHKAFGSYLSPPERGLDWYRSHYEQQQLLQGQQQAQSHPRWHQVNRNRFKIWSSSRQTATPPPHLVKWTSQAPPNKKQSSGASPKSTEAKQMSLDSSKISTNDNKAANNAPHQRLQQDKGVSAFTSPSQSTRKEAFSPTSSSLTTTTTTSSSESTDQGQQQVVLDAPEKKVAQPKVEFLRPLPEETTGGFWGGGDGQSWSGVLVGVAFVAAFLVVALGLAAGRLFQPGFGDGGREDGGGGGEVLFQMRSPEDEERTPPELRGYGGHPAFVQPGDEEDPGSRRGGGRRGREADCNGQVTTQNECQSAEVFVVYLALPTALLHRPTDSARGS